MRWTLLALLLASPASADVISGDYEPPSCPPMTCPPATNPIAGGGHGSCPVGCSPNQRTCTTDAECTAGGLTGTRCVETRYCIARTSNGRLADVPTVMGEIDARGNCAEGTPTVQKLCTNPPRAASQDDDDGCSVGGASSVWPALLLLAVLRRR